MRTLTPRSAAASKRSCITLPTSSKLQMKLCKSIELVAVSIARKRQPSAPLPSFNGTCQSPLLMVSISDQMPRVTAGGVVSSLPSKGVKVVQAAMKVAIRNGR